MVSVRHRNVSEDETAVDVGGRVCDRVTGRVDELQVLSGVRSDDVHLTDTPAGVEGRGRRVRKVEPRCRHRRVRRTGGGTGARAEHDRRDDGHHR